MNIFTQMDYYTIVMIQCILKSMLDECAGGHKLVNQDQCDGCIDDDLVQYKELYHSANGRAPSIEEAEYFYYTDREGRKKILSQLSTNDSNTNDNTNNNNGDTTQEAECPTPAPTIITNNTLDNTMITPTVSPSTTDDDSIATIGDIDNGSTLH